MDTVGLAGSGAAGAAAAVVGVDMAAAWVTPNLKPPNVGVVEAAGAAEAGAASGLLLATNLKPPPAPKETAGLLASSLAFTSFSCPGLAV